MTAAETATGTVSLPTEQSAPDRLAVEQRLSQVLELCRTGRPEEAEGPYRTLCGNPPRDAAGLLSMAEAARILARPADAVAWAEAAVRAQADRADGWSVLALAFIAAGRADDGYAAAAEALRRTGTWKPGSGEPGAGTAAIQAHRAQALARLRRGQLAEAAAACDTALRLADAVAQAPQAVRQARAETLGTLALVRMLEGRAEEAEALFRRALSHRPVLPEILGNHASLLARLGRDGEALEQAEQAMALRPRLTGTLHLIGTLHHRAGQLEAAIAAFHRVLAVDPGHLDARLRLADSLRVAGHWQEAATVCRDGLARIANPDDPNRTPLLANLGAALQTGGDAAGALEAYREALRLSPDLPEVHNNLARLHQETGNPDAAIEELRRATAGRPASQPLPLALRHALLSLLIAAGRTAEAEAEAFGIARTAPEDAELCFGIAALFLQGGWRDQALPYVRKAIRLAPDMPRNWIAFVEALRDATPPQPDTGLDEGLRADLLAALGRPEVESAGLTRAIAGVLLASPVIRTLAALPEDAGPALDDASRTLLADGSLAGLAEDVLLLAHLRAAPVCDPTLERALTRLRRVLLLALTGPGLPDRPSWRALCAAIAEQGFLNEYVFAETDGEFQVLAVLLRAAEAALASGEQPPAVLVALLGAYRPLYRWERAEALQALSWPEEIARLLERQVAEPLAEAAIQAELPALTPISHPVSVGVRAQYEENPYPRWMTTGLLPEPVPLPRFLHALFPHAALPASPAWPSAWEAPGWEAPEVLVAGCGTGREAVWAASTLKNAKVLAVDLSRRSLAYATRQSRRLGLKSIEFAQADLLELGTLDRRFDVIHSVGVLHHMEDPMAGLRVLRGLLRPHGVMEVGFYSAAARRPVLAARQFIAERGHPPTLDGIRHVRRDIQDLPDGHPARAVVHSPDFYGTSACRDLLMHVHELHVTLPWLAGALEALGLEFLGFRLADPAVAALYRKRFPEDPAMTSLGRWDRLEAEHPMIFGGLYQAWVRG
ncbi:Tetratricopeptide repeat-containing protein [Azospirillum oryzae]|uniref:Tetratricopeptide repeat-containing protein n=1 Tax=Azospirillum oryzae TaxID=286727 RepID=A0A1X7F090_9PROT|nr:class I SAM-dependent methyltransferase [Azospirillum oryzae]SMF43509.1 Tetratricopeptide repeat-containing protein [Azospirillum oryzae]